MDSPSGTFGFFCPDLRNCSLAYALICGIALWLIHDKYTMATIVMGVGAVMVIAGMLAERFIVGYHDD